MASLRKLKDLSVLQPNKLEMLSSLVLGSNDIGIYDPDNVYNTGDRIVIVDEEGKIIILESSKNGITGPFDRDDWIEVDSIINNVDISNNPNGSQGVNSITRSLLEDTLTLVHQNDLGLPDSNNIFRIEFHTTSQIDLIDGLATYGKIYI